VLHSKNCAILEKYSGIQSEVVGDRISESLSGETAQVAVKIFGDDLDALDATGDKIVAAMGKVPGIVDLQFKRQGGTPTIAIEVLPQALSATGLKVQDVSIRLNRRMPGRSSDRHSKALAPSGLSCCCPVPYGISPPDWRSSWLPAP
jgi:Cu/Ag efflux pump CusA